MPTNYPNSSTGNMPGEGFLYDSEPRKSDDVDKLKRIRDRYTYMEKSWKEIWDQADLDQRALSIGGPWKQEDREAREAKGRPCLHQDQIGQYVSALVNQVRAEPIAVKVNAGGEGTDDKTAELRSKRIRAIEYDSMAQQAYQVAFECAASIGFGAFGITIDYKSWDSMQRVIKVLRFANPWSVLWDPDCKEADFSDMRDAFELYEYTRDDFKHDFADAQMVSFGEYQTQFPNWFGDNRIQVAKYWYVEKTPVKIYWVQEPQGLVRYIDAKAKVSKPERFTRVEGYKIDKKRGLFIYKDGSAAQLVEMRETQEPLVRMCVTNGVEILEENDWPGKEIPIIPVVGKEEFYREGKKVKRMLKSYIRMARDGQMMFDYYASAEAETIGMTPKTPWLGYKGQFVEDYWKDIHQEPRAFAEVEPIVDPNTGQLLPLPQRQVFEPPVQAIEIGKESARRSMQASVASYGYTRLDDTNVKSGKALEQLAQQRDLGSFHFVDNYKIAVRRAGRIINDLLDDVEQGPMTVPLVGLDDEREMANLNQPGPNGQMVQYRLTDEGQHEVTISTGPSFESQRAEATAFTDSMVSNLKNMPLDPQMAVKVLAMLVKLRQLGPIGDKIVEILDPDPNPEIPPQIQQKLQQQQQIIQAMQAYAQQLEGAMAEIQQTLDSKVLDIESREKIAALQADVQKLKIIADAGASQEKLRSTENVEIMKVDLQRQLAEVQARIDAVAATQKTNGKTQ